jgi:hypothetical protein
MHRMHRECDAYQIHPIRAETSSGSHSAFVSLVPFVAISLLTRPKPSLLPRERDFDEIAINTPL